MTRSDFWLGVCQGLLDSSRMITRLAQEEKDNEKAQIYLDVAKMLLKEYEVAEKKV